jgi:hypothetical protein
MSSILKTLDTKHKDYLTEFEWIEQQRIPELNEQIREDHKKIKELKQQGKHTIDNQMELYDRIKNSKKEINELNGKKTSYYLDNAKHIFDYYDSKKQFTQGNNQVKVLYSFFKVKPEDEDEKTHDNYIKKYMTNINEISVDLDDYKEETAQYCDCGGELVQEEQAGRAICKKCFKQEIYLVEFDKPTYKEPPKEVSFYAYKRINHFREILAQFQAKETTYIPDEVIENIQHQIRKERITLDQLTNNKTKHILKNLGYNKYYEHIPFIKDKLGIKPPVMSPELEERLCGLFYDIQRPYTKHCPDGRVNFLNYYYVLYKMCELLGETQFLPHFPMLKDRVKRIEQDEIWRKICEELDWEFISTV